MRANGREECIAELGGNTTLYCPFEKPWFVTLEMKCGMACSLLLHLAIQLRQRCERRRGAKRVKSAPLLGAAEDEDSQRDSPFRTYFTPTQSRAALGRRQARLAAALEEGSGSAAASSRRSEGGVRCTSLLLIAIPSFLDLSQTVLANIGLIFVQSSVYMMTRGVVLVFSAVFSVTILRKKMRSVHLAAVLLVIISIAMVGAAGFEIEDRAEHAGANGSAARWLVGVALIVVAQIACALQVRGAPLFCFLLFWLLYSFGCTILRVPEWLRCSAARAQHVAVLSLTPHTTNSYHVHRSSSKSF